MIALNAISYAYPGQENQPVFDGFSWRAERGEAWAVLGPSGCGKSTLLYLLAGLRFPQQGQVWIGDQPLVRPRPQTGLILQDYGLLPWATIRENIRLGQRIRNFYGPDGTHAPSPAVNHAPAQTATAELWLERLGLAEVAGKYPNQVSGGQRQRAAIARTLILSPDLLLMDEPFSSLDAPTREALQNLTLELYRENHLTLVIVTHAIEEAAILGRKILVLNTPPNRETLVVDNPAASQDGFRHSQAYLDLCRDLREKLESR
jgi:NitT/TauT family transport system ATP-binding protein